MYTLSFLVQIGASGWLVIALSKSLEVIIEALGKIKKFFSDKVYYRVFEQVLEIMRDNGDFSDNFESVLNYIYQYALDFATEELCECAYVNWEEELHYHKSICFDLEYEFEESDFDFLELNFELDPKKVKEIVKKFNDFMRGWSQCKKKECNTTRSQ